MSTRAETKEAFFTLHGGEMTYPVARLLLDLAVLVIFLV